MDYNIIQLDFLNKYGTGQQNVGIAAMPATRSQSRASIGTVWKTGCKGG